MENCENCGLPAWAVEGSGVSITIEEKGENRFQRTRKRTVWCHSQECAIQRLAIAKYGKDASKWPITLAQFRALNPLNQSSDARSSKRSRSSRKAKDLIWGASKAFPTAQNRSGRALESRA